MYLLPKTFHVSWMIIIMFLCCNFCYCLFYLYLYRLSVYGKLYQCTNYLSLEKILRLCRVKFIINEELKGIIFDIYHLPHSYYIQKPSKHLKKRVAEKIVYADRVHFAHSCRCMHLYRNSNIIVVSLLLQER